MNIATRKRVASKLWSYRDKDGRIGFSPDARIVHLPLCKYCLFVPLLGWFKSPLRPWTKDE